ncbi:MAG: DUF2442 domain-containing protein [Ruminococcus sp.]|nr:DUF2442 domain-containing protein [Ruminococcus sp.]
MLDEKMKKYFENPRKILSVKPTDDFCLILEFDNGEIRLYEMQDAMHGVLEVLKEKRKFQSVFLDEFGNVAWDIDESKDSSVYWNNRIDICKDSIYMESRFIMMKK